MATIKNLQSLEKLLGICTGLGEYQPGQQKLQVEAMTTLLSQAQTSVNKVNAARTAFENATNNREVAFSGLASLGTRLLGALIASGAMPQTVDDARTMTRKLAGYHPIDRTPLPASAGEVGTTSPAPKRRARGLDYNSASEYFAKLIETLSAEANYQPREADLQIAALKDQLGALQSNNSKVIQTTEAWRKARNERDQILYGPGNSLYQVGQMVKQYVKSVYGFKNENHRSVRKLKFTNKPE